MTGYRAAGMLAVLALLSGGEAWGQQDAATIQEGQKGMNVNARLENGLALQLGTSTGRTSENDCEIAQRLPEMNESRRLQFCDRQTPWLTSIKGYAVYTVPRLVRFT
ncbi:MAG: hypothetical protein HY657_18860 [Acidobacteria bacterium]|nr:hypothetical protein [Acidobacteriota bacterium]